MGNLFSDINGFLIFKIDDHEYQVKKNPSKGHKI